jgi:hypothetical protein
VFVGAIGDYGTAVNVNKNGKPNPNGNYVRVKLQKGTFMIDVTAMNEAAAPVTFLNGTRLYKGISGTANLALTFGGVGSRYKSGPKRASGSRTRAREQRSDT